MGLNMSCEEEEIILKHALKDRYQNLELNYTANWKFLSR